MQADPDQETLKALSQWAEKFACPACLGELHLDSASVTCASCLRVYPIVDGIPVLIVERSDKSGPS